MLPRSSQEREGGHTVSAHGTAADGPEQPAGRPAGATATGAPSRARSWTDGADPGGAPEAGTPGDPLAAGALGDVAAEAEGERPARVLTGRLRLAVSVVAALLSVYALWNVFFPVPALQYRIIFLAVVLPLTFLLYRPALAVLRRGDRRDRPGGGGGGAGPRAP